jgi:hypothetical protein
MPYQVKRDNLTFAFPRTVHKLKIDEVKISLQKALCVNKSLQIYKIFIINVLY